MDRVNRDLRNAEVAFNQAEQVANEAADADRKAILEQNATAILLVSWTVCARGIEAEHYQAIINLKKKLNRLRISAELPILFFPVFN